jgi:hypothetical protein
VHSTQLSKRKYGILRTLRSTVSDLGAFDNVENDARQTPAVAFTDREKFVESFRVHPLINS